MKTDKYKLLIAQEISRDEENSGNNNFNQQENFSSGPSGFNLGDLLSLLGENNDSPYVSIVEKIHALLGQVGKKGLDNEGKAAIDSLVKDLNKYAPKIGPLIQRLIQDYGYNLDAEIPLEFALGGYVAFVGFRLQATRKEFLKVQTNEKKEENSKEEKPWQ